MEIFDNGVREAKAKIETLKPEIGDLGEGLARLQDMLSSQLERTAEVGSRNEIMHPQRLIDHYLELSKDFASQPRGSHQPAEDSFCAAVVCP